MHKIKIDAETFSFGAIPTAFQAVGRIIVDVFGFGALLDRIEEYFGRKVCGAFLLLLGCTAVVLCINAIITLGFIPIRDFFMSQISLPDALVRIASGALAGGLCAWFLSLLAFRYFSAKIDRVAEDAKADLQRAEEVLKEANAIADATRQLANELVDSVAQEPR